MENTGSTKNCLLISVVAFLAIVVFSQEKCSAEQMVSSPIPSKAKGLREGWENWYVGAGYFEGNSKVKDNDGNSYDQSISQAYGILGYRWSPWTETYLKIGAAGFDFGDGIKSSDKLFVTGGLYQKWYIAPSGSYSVWSSLQLAWYSTQKLTVPNNGVNENVELNAWEGNAALGMDYKIPLSSSPNLLSVYGGLLAKYGQEDLDTTTSTGETVTSSLRIESYFGGIAGLRVVPLNGFNIVFEAQYIDDFSLGVNLVYAFPVDH